MGVEDPSKWEIKNSRWSLEVGNNELSIEALSWSKTLCLQSENIRIMPINSRESQKQKDTKWRGWLQDHHALKNRGTTPSLKTMLHFFFRIKILLIEIRCRKECEKSNTLKTLKILLKIHFTDLSIGVGLLETTLFSLISLFSLFFTVYGGTLLSVVLGSTFAGKKIKYQQQCYKKGFLLT